MFRAVGLESTITVPPGLKQTGIDELSVLTESEWLKHLNSTSIAYVRNTRCFSNQSVPCISVKAPYDSTGVAEAKLWLVFPNSQQSAKLHRATLFRPNISAQPRPRIEPALMAFG